MLGAAFTWTGDELATPTRQQQDRNIKPIPAECLSAAMCSGMAHGMSGTDLEQVTLREVTAERALFQAAGTFL